MTQSRGFEIINSDGVQWSSLPAELQKPLDIVYAFADDRFGGNPAGVALLPRFYPTEQLQATARAAGLPTTVFVASSSDTNREKGGTDFDIRWFTPSAELALCGHGTLAMAHWLFSRDIADGDTLRFMSKSGVLSVERERDEILMCFPSISSTAVDVNTKRSVSEALGMPLVECRLAYDDFIAVVADESMVTNFKPDFSAIRQLDCRGIAVTAQADPDGPYGEYDIVSRFFAPTISVDEDQVCVSAHCKLHPYWAERLDRAHLRALQPSASGGWLDLNMRDGNVLIKGTARLAAERNTHKSDIGATCIVERVQPIACAEGVTMSALVDMSDWNTKPPFSTVSFRVEPGCATVAEMHDVA